MTVDPAQPPCCFQANAPNFRPTVYQCAAGPDHTREPPPASAGIRRPRSASKRVHRCSRCGAIGHNVRACPSQEPWFTQRCSNCGRPGHNIRNCPVLKPASLSATSASSTRSADNTVARSEARYRAVASAAAAAAAPVALATIEDCRVCKGRRRLPCSQCGGVQRRHPSTFLHSPNRPSWAHPGVHFLDEPPALVGASSSTMTPAQKRMASRVRARIRETQLRDTDQRDESTVLIGQPSEQSTHQGPRWPDHVQPDPDELHDQLPPCSRCLGTGFLTCIACSE